MSPNYALFAIPVFLFLLVLELVISKVKKKNYYRFHDTITNLNVGMGMLIVGAFTRVILLLIYGYFYRHYAVFSLGSGILTWVACFIVFDFLFYWAHRWGHTVNFFWGAHLVHHQSEEYNLSVALRQSWFHALIAFPILLPMPLLGFDPLMILAVSGIDSFYQFLIHTKAIGKLGFLEKFMNTPSHHRVHHAINPRYLDKNYGGTFIIWDRMFGTYVEEEEEPEYGITQPLKSWNPVWANFHYYFELAEMSTRFSNLFDKIKLLFVHPAWGSAGESEKTYKLIIREKYDTPTSEKSNRYVLVQFLLILAGTVAFLANYKTMSVFYKSYFGALLIISFLICGAIFENKRWVIGAEYLRLAIILGGLSTFYYFWYYDWFWVVMITSSVLYVYFNGWHTLNWRIKDWSFSSLFNNEKAV